MSNRRKKRREGFTLLEIVVSITLLALIALMLSRVFNESSKTIGRGRGGALLDESARMLFEYMEQDISQALIRTNVAFRIHPETRNGSLSFVSPAARKLHAEIGRDTAPMRIESMAAQTNNLAQFNRSFSEEAPDSSSVDTPATIRNLMAHSDYYFSEDRSSIPDFTPSADTYSATYIQSLSDHLEDHAVLTFIEFRINAESDSAAGTPESPPNMNNMPRFIDISIGLISARDLQTAQRKNDPGHVEKHERLYARRIMLVNRAPEMISF